MDQLRHALATALGVPDAPPAPAVKSPLPDPLDSDWVALLRRLGIPFPATPTLGQLVQRSDAASREREAGGRKREAAELRSAKDRYLKAREQTAWALVKARFADLELSEKAYRALKQEGAMPEKVFDRLAGKRGDALRGAGAARIREALLG